MGRLGECALVSAIEWQFNSVRAISIDWPVLPACSDNEFSLPEMKHLTVNSSLHSLIFSRPMLWQKRFVQNPPNGPELEGHTCVLMISHSRQFSFSPMIRFLEKHKITIVVPYKKKNTGHSLATFSVELLTFVDELEKCLLILLVCFIVLFYFAPLQAPWTRSVKVERFCFCTFYKFTINSFRMELVNSSSSLKPLRFSSILFFP